MSKKSLRFKLVLAAFAASLSPSLALAQTTIVYAGAGGVAQEASNKAIWQPIAKQMGIVLKMDTTNNGLADVRAQVKANAVKWDIVKLSPDMCAQGEKEGLFVDMDYKVINREGFPKGVMERTYVSQTYFSNVIAWNTAKYGANGPKSWSDFWDVKKFPGTRALRNYPAEVLEAALLADGVSRDKLYPLDIDRAFASLNKIKPHVSVWWSSGAQAMQLVKDGEVDMIGTWNGRIEAAVADGAKAAFTYNDAIIVADCLVVPKGAKNVELSMKALSLALRPESSAELTKFNNYGPVNAKAYDLISKERAKELNSSPDNIRTQALFNGAWWADNGPAALERWRKFVQQ